MLAGRAALSGCRWAACWRTRLSGWCWRVDGAQEARVVVKEARSALKEATHSVVPLIKGAFARQHLSSATKSAAR